MNRRTILAKLATLPFIGFLFRPVAEATPAVLQVRQEQAEWGSKVLFAGPLGIVNKHDAMMQAADEIEHGINQFLRHCAQDNTQLEKIEIQWMQFPNFEDSGGAFHIVGTRGNSIAFKREPLSLKEWRNNCWPTP